jgi:carboxyl-terminal processing protease
MKNWRPYLIGALAGGALVLLGLTGLKQLPLPVTASVTPADADFSPLWEAWRTINQNYQPSDPKAEPVNPEKRVWGAVRGLVDSLGDPYSVFMTPEENKSFSEEIGGHFGGIGIEIGVRDRALTIISALPNTPARAAGLRSGDKLIEVDGQAVGETGLYEAIELIRGEVGSPVKLTISRKGSDKPLTVSLKRAVIEVPTIETKTESGAFIIRLYNFGATSPELFKNALREFILSGQSKLVIDLRGNPGGFLEAAVDMASWFLPAGTPVVSEESENDANNQVYRSRGYNVFNDDLKLVILVDSGSASAAEILAGALADNHRAILVGEKTFGKGSVQELLPLSGGGALKLTIARWLTPNGTSISKTGITPNLEVKFTPEDAAAGRDPQLAKALAL